MRASSHASFIAAIIFLFRKWKERRNAFAAFLGHQVPVISPAELAASAVNAAFSGPTGHAAVADGSAEGTKAVIVVANATVPAFDPVAAEIPQIREQVAEQIANDYVQQFLVEMQSQLGLSVNQAAVQAVVGGPQQPGT